MHERKLPKDSTKPWLEEGSHCLPITVLDKEKRPGEEDGSSWFSSKMVSKGSQEEGEENGVIKTPLSTKEEGHAGRERMAGREEKKNSFTVQKLQEFW
ncbi:hypothetical protein AAC387_Pa02g2191 [Persea americana]